MQGQYPERLSYPRNHSREFHRRPNLLGYSLELSRLLEYFQSFGGQQRGLSCSSLRHVALEAKGLVRRVYLAEQVLPHHQEQASFRFPRTCESCCVIFAFSTEYFAHQWLPVAGEIHLRDH